MYRARAESISGTKVYAGGKWLTCIGNKIVRVGDYIWTDGRVVYGNHLEAQQPLVITAPPQQLDDEGIPILLYSSQNRNYLFYTFSKRGLTQVFTKDKDSDISFIVNDSKANIYSLSDENFLSVNVDDRGNIFKLIGYNNVTDSKVLVEIKVNDSTVTTFNSSDFFDITEAVAPFPVEYFAVDHYEFGRAQCNAEVGFIEDADNWAFIVTSVIGEQTYYVLETDLQYKTYGTATFYRLYFVTPKGITPLFNSDFIITEEEIKNIEYPLGDGNYYRITEIERGSNNWGSTWEYFYLTIFSAEHKKICKVIGQPFSSYLTLKKFCSNYLLGLFNAGIF